MEQESGRKRLSDSMGEMWVPGDALWGAQTQRAVENFPISGVRFPRSFLRALGQVKRAGALANVQLGVLPEVLSEAIVAAACEVEEGTLDSHFPLDVFQTGSGTSTNMNANEVIAHRSMQLLRERGTDLPVHPNDHVNASQSSNDVIPTVIHLAVAVRVEKELLPRLGDIVTELDRKAAQFLPVIKMGRTHLQDATPVRMGQVFSGYAAMFRKVAREVERALPDLLELAIGGTAVGTGLNAPPGFAGLVCESLSLWNGMEFREAGNHFEAQGGKGALVAMSGALRGVAVASIKVANDIRWMGSGPRAGLGELLLPSVQPGSSIMPGKVNPVMAEALVMAATQVLGNDHVVALAGAGGHFELNAMMPLLAHNLLQSIDLLAHALEQFNLRCLSGLDVSEAACSSSLEKSLALVTSLVPAIGYDRAAKLAGQAHREGRTIRELCMSEGVLSREELDKLLDPQHMV